MIALIAGVIIALIGASVFAYKFLDDYITAIALMIILVALWKIKIR